MRGITHTFMPWKPAHPTRAMPYWNEAMGNGRSIFTRWHMILSRWCNWLWRVDERIGRGRCKPDMRKPYADLPIQANIKATAKIPKPTLALT